MPSLDQAPGETVTLGTEGAAPDREGLLKIRFNSGILDSVGVAPVNSSACQVLFYLEHKIITAATDFELHPAIWELAKQYRWALVVNLTFEMFDQGVCFRCCLLDGLRCEIVEKFPALCWLKKRTAKFNIHLSYLQRES